MNHSLPAVVAENAEIRRHRVPWHESVAENRKRSRFDVLCQRPWQRTPNIEKSASPATLRYHRPTPFQPKRAQHRIHQARTPHASPSPAEETHRRLCQHTRGRVTPVPITQHPSHRTRARPYPQALHVRKKHPTPKSGAPCHHTHMTSDAACQQTCGIPRRRGNTKDTDHNAPYRSTVRAMASFSVCSRITGTHGRALATSSNTPRTSITPSSTLHR